MSATQNKKENNKMNTTLAYCEEKIEGALNQKLFALCTSANAMVGIMGGRKSLRADKTLCLKTSKLNNAIDNLMIQRAQLESGWEGVSITSIVEVIRECMGAVLELGSFLGDSYPHEYAEIEAEGTEYVKNCWALIRELSA